MRTQSTPCSMAISAELGIVVDVGDQGDVDAPLDVAERLARRSTSGTATRTSSQPTSSQAHDLRHGGVDIARVHRSHRLHGDWRIAPMRTSPT